MNSEDFKRKLTTIFSADVVGYSRLMGEDESATVRTLDTYKEVIFSLIKQHRGRVVDSPGDNVLAEFGSVVDALQSAITIQKELRTRNSDLPKDRRMQFRMGINLGDVIEEQDRIYGDGVNIAARLEALADPGGICISKTAFDQVESKLPMGYQFLGEQKVKNIAKPIGAYRVMMDTRVTGRGDNEIDRASEKRMAYPLPDKPSIAVLPFVNMSGDPEQEYLGDGITESIITAISKLYQIFVIARNSTFSYKNKAVKVQQVAEELGVQYVLEGSVQKSGNKLRITAQLIDALNGRHIWAQRYDRELTDLFAMQDDITMEILQAMRVKLTEGEQVLRLKRPKNIELAMKMYEAQDYAHRFDPEANEKAQRLHEEIIAADPDLGEAYFALAAGTMMDVWLGTTKSPGESIEKAIALLEKALSLDNSLATALGLMGFLYGMKRDYDKAIAYGEKAVEKDPNGADSHAYLGIVLNFVSRPLEAVSHFEIAMRRNPYPPQWYYTNFAGAYSMLGRNEEAFALAKKALDLWPTSVVAHCSLIFTYWDLGEEDKARAAASELLKISPKFSVEKYGQTTPSKDREYVKRMTDALCKAGLPN